MHYKLFNYLALKEIFHLEFLRWLSRKIKMQHYVLKGGINLRFFFKSIRYSEDMDLDIQGISVEKLKEVVMKILKSTSFQDAFKAFGIMKVVPPDIRKAKQTTTTQRFKIHLILSSGEDLFTKIEFSRRGFSGTIKIESVNSAILKAYRLAPLIVPHYDAISAMMQKIEAIAARSIIQARDIFDLYMLIPQCSLCDSEKITYDKAKLAIAYENIFKIDFGKFRDTVISYLSPEDQFLYNSSVVWDEIRLRVANFINEMLKYGNN